MCFYSSMSLAVELTEKERQWLKNNQEFTFFNDDYDSRLFFIENNVQKGLYFDLIQDINKKLNTNFKIQIEKIDDLIKKFNNVETGAYFDFAKTKDRSEHYNFVPTLYRVNIKVYYKDAAKIPDLVSLNNKKVGLIEEWYSTTNFVHQYVDDINYIPVRFSSLNEAVAALNAGEIDAFIADTQVSGHKSFLAHKLPRLDHLYTSFATTKDHPEIHNILIKYFNNLSALEVQALVKKHVKIILFMRLGIIKACKVLMRRWVMVLMNSLPVTLLVISIKVLLLCFLTA